MDIAIPYLHTGPSAFGDDLDYVAQLSAALGRIRAAIEHAKGMLMLVYDIDDQRAFAVLKWLSQQNNVRLRLLAEQISTDLRVMARAALTDKSAFDHLLITAHERLSQ